MNASRPPRLFDPETLEVMQDPAHRAMLDSLAGEFRHQMKSWQLNKRDAHSPPLPADIQSLLVDAFYAQVNDFYLADKIPANQFRKRRYERVKTLLTLEHALEEHEAIEAYTGRRRQAVMCLIGSVIDRSLTGATSVGVASATVDDRFFPHVAEVGGKGTPPARPVGIG